MSGTYCNGDSRKLILETLAWSFNCLSGPTAKITTWLKGQKSPQLPRYGRISIFRSMGKAVFQGVLRWEMGNGRSANCWWLCGSATWNPGGPGFHKDFDESHAFHSWSCFLFCTNLNKWPYLFLSCPRKWSKKNQFFHVARLSLKGFFSRQQCCYYCRAVQWVYLDENPEMNQYLYTNFGRNAAHRNTFLMFVSETKGFHEHIVGVFWMWLNLRIRSYLHGIRTSEVNPSEKRIPINNLYLVLFLGTADLRMIPSIPILYLIYYLCWPRLVSLQEWFDINPRSPLTRIAGWNPWRSPAIIFEKQFHVENVHEQISSAFEKGLANIFKKKSLAGHHFFERIPCFRTVGGSFLFENQSWLNHLLPRFLFGSLI